jgi:hypothetical protein
VQANFPKCTDRYLKPAHRTELFIHMILNLKRHLVCIHEVEGPQVVDRMRTIRSGHASSFSSQPLRLEVPIVAAATFFLKVRLIVEKTITV